MLTLIKQPESISLAGDPVLFQIQSDDFITTEGSYASMHLFINKNIENTNYIDLTIASKTIRLTAATVKDESGNQFRTKGSILQVISWVKLVCEDIKENYLLSDLFDISYNFSSANSMYVINFIAKEKGKLNILLNANTLTNSLFQFTDGIDEVRKEYHRILAQVYGNNNKINEYALLSDRAGLAVFDISTAAMTLLESKFQFPEESIAVNHLSMIAKCNLRYTQLSGDETIPNYRIQTSSTITVIPGKLQDYKKEEYFKTNYSFYKRTTISRAFLNWHPGNKKILYDQIEKLYFYRLEFGVYLLNIKSYKNDVLLDNKSANFGSINIDPEIWELQISPQLHSLNSEADKFDVYISFNGKIASEIRTYFIDKTPYANKKVFLFKNSLGCFESILFTGRSKQAAKISRQAFEVIKSTDWNIYNKKTTQFNDYKSTAEATSGWLSREEITWANEFLCSEEVYEVLSSDRITPIKLTSNDISLTEDNVFNYYLSIKYEYTNSAYTYAQDAMPDDSDFNLDFNLDFKA